MFKLPIIGVVAAIVVFALISIVAAINGSHPWLGERAEVGPAQVAKIMTQDGYRDDVIETSRFRLDRCLVYCDRIVYLDVSDQSRPEDIRVFMPEDRLNLDYGITAVLSIDSTSIEELFTKIPPVNKNGRLTISLDRVYETYAKELLRSESREFMTQFSIADIAGNRDTIGTQLSARLQQQLKEKTPFTLRYATISQVDYPPLIIDAQEDAAKRREDIQRERASLEVARVRFERELEEQRLNRQVEIEKAEAEREVNRILAESVTEKYKTYRMLAALDKIADSENTKFLPVEMLGTMATDVMMGREGVK